MGVLSNIRARILALGKIVPATGPRVLPTGEEDYAAHIANEGAGGAHGYESLEDLASAKPALLEPPMLAMVQEHQRPDGSHHPLTMYLLLQKPEKRLIDMPGEFNDIMAQFWTVYNPNRAVAPVEAPAMRYAPNVDARSGNADANGGRPIFPGSSTGRAITQAEYNALVVGTTVNVVSNNLSTGTPTPIEGYWSTDLDSSKHFWWSQKIPGTDNWSAPISFGSESVEANDFTATIYMWATEQPAQPPYYLPGTGQKNNNPSGWLDAIPAVRPSAAHKLWATKAKKSASFELKSDWFPPYEIPLDPARVRYSEKRTPDPNAINAGVFDEVKFTAEGWLAMATNQSRFIARRMDTTSSWFIEQMAGESGAYTDTIYRNFKLSEYDDIMNAVTAPLFRPTGKAPVGWSDVPVAPALDEITMQSSAEKYVTGDLIGAWSNPMPANGQDVFFDEIRSEGGSDFHTEGTKTVPAIITLRAVLSRGKAVIPVADIKYQWKKIYDNGTVLDELLTGNDSLVVSPQDVKGLAIYECVQSFGGTDYRSEYTIQDITDGIDALALDIRASSHVVVFKPDGTRIPAKVELRAFGQNLSDLGKYTWKKDGVLIMDPNDTAQPFKGSVLNIDYADLHATGSVKYSVHTVDSHPGDEVTISKVSESVGADAITLILDNESQVLVLDAATGTTNFAAAKTRVQIFNGASDETGSWSFAKTDTNVTSTIEVMKNGAGVDIPGTRQVRVTDMAAGQTVGSVVVTATKNGRTLSKTFSVARITDPVGATIARMEAETAGGFSFSPTETGNKRLRAKLNVGGQDLTSDKFSTKWFLGTATVASSSLDYVDISRSQVNFALTVRCEITYLGKKYTTVRDISDVRDAYRKGKLYTSSEVDSSGNTINLDDLPPSTHAWNAGNVSVGAVNWSTSRLNAVYETTREEYEAAWTAPVRIAGEKGTPGLNGTSTRMAKIYQWSVSEPLKPSTMDLVPNGWTADTFGARPTENHQLWLCMGDKTIEDNPKLLPPGWSAVVPFSGLRGPAGVGTPGQAATIGIDSVKTVAHGQPATVQNMGTAQDAKLAFEIPQGPQGVPGVFDYANVWEGPWERSTNENGMFCWFRRTVFGMVIYYGHLSNSGGTCHMPSAKYRPYFGGTSRTHSAQIGGTAGPDRSFIKFGDGQVSTWSDGQTGSFSGTYFSTWGL